MGYDFTYFVADVIKLLLMLGFCMNLAVILVYTERRQSAFMQDRIGPNRAGIKGFTLAGLFHPIADTFKMILKEDFLPARGDKFLHHLAPFMAMFPALLVFIVIPFGPDITVFGRVIKLQVANLDVGILFLFAFSSLCVYGTVLAGWSSNNKWALLGGLRASAQMFSYEVTMGLTIIGVCMIFQTLRLDQMVLGQGELLWGVIPKWGIVVQPLGFILFLIAAIAEIKRTPFDLPEGEPEVIGYFLEYSGLKFGMFMVAEFIEIVIISMLVTTIFLGGWQVPYLLADGFHFPLGVKLLFPAGLTWLIVVLQILTFVLKTVFVCWVLQTLRWTLPRFRYDQLMGLGWKVLLPLSLLNIAITGIVVLFLN